MRDRICHKRGGAEDRWEVEALYDTCFAPGREALSSYRLRDGVEQVGDAPYYGRFGFEKLGGVVMPPPTNPERVLGIGDWQGIAGDVEKWA